MVMVYVADLKTNQQATNQKQPAPNPTNHVILPAKGEKNVITAAGAQTQSYG